MKKQATRTTGPRCSPTRHHLNRRSSQSTPEQDQQNDDRQRHSNQPQQRTFSDTHDNSPFSFVGTTRDIDESSKSQANSDGE
jgi:hypothetical protein